jgi:FlaA1/EpsC-like NDP-sugar epimerase
MTIPEACQLVLQAGSMAKGGEIFVLDMGEPIKIVDLARDLIRLSGFEPETDIPIKIIGLRPGEKLFEEFLLNKERVSKTEHDKIYIEKPLADGFDGLEMNIQRLRTAIEVGTNDQVISLLKVMVPTYKTNMYSNDKYMPIKDEAAVTLNQISSHR